MTLHNSKLIYTMVFLSWQSLFLIVLLCSHVTSILANTIPASQASFLDKERSALMQFKDNFFLDCDFSQSPNAYPKMKSWERDLNGDCCSWDGVQCDKMGHVIGLNLSSSCVYGTFPANSSLFSLTHLQQLDLSGNFFHYSPIPSEIGQLSKLRSLNLSESYFSGQIPSEISRLSKLSVLDLQINLPGWHLLQLHDPSFEQIVRNLTQLEVLFLDIVDISSPIPNILSNLTSLRVISLSYCNLLGQLPTSIFHLPHLNTLTLTGNIDLAGNVPDEFHQNSPLFSLYLDQTTISGKIPPSIGKVAHLEKFSLRESHFSGTIPSSLGNLTKLKILELSENYFSGDMPYSLANLTQLIILDISNVTARPDNLFSWLFNLNKLTHLELKAMNLTTEIPSFFANFTSLVKLDLGNNQLIGEIPHWLMNLTQLEKLLLSDNQLKGPISPWISQLSSLTVLQLSNNDKLYGNFDALLKLQNLLGLELSGVRLTFSSRTANESLPKLDDLILDNCNLTEFPQFLHRQYGLQILSLHGNNIHGLIPKWFVNVTRKSLYSLDLSRNLLTGFEQPFQVPPWSRLNLLFLEGNNLQGSLPVPSTSMAVYQVSNNLFAGPIPQEICRASSLVYFDVSNNELDGQIPECISELGASLVILDLKGNNFQGTIPYSYPKSCKLQMINLSQNQLEGNVPRSLANCIMLEALDFGNNHINGTFPSWLGSLPNLQILSLRQNHFYGTLGRRNATAGFPSLRIIDLSHNFHTGDLPSHYFQKWHAMKTIDEGQSIPSSIKLNVDVLDGTGYFTWFAPYAYSITITNKGNDMVYTKILNVFRVVDFSSNNFTGRIPDSVGESRGLQALNLSNNNLEGGIPASLANMRDLESLDLSTNMLSGEIPQELTQLTFLEVFNVSHNLLVGPIPHGRQFNAFDNSSFDGNLGLCGSPLSKKCGNVYEPPPPVEPENEKEDDSNLIDWIVWSLGCVGGFACGFAIGLYITDRNHEWFLMTFGRRPRTRVRRTAQRRS